MVKKTPPEQNNTNLTSQLGTELEIFSRVSKLGESGCYSLCLGYPPKTSCSHKWAFSEVDGSRVCKDGLRVYDN